MPSIGSSPQVLINAGTIFLLGPLGSVNFEKFLQYTPGDWTQVHQEWAKKGNCWQSLHFDNWRSCSSPVSSYPARDPMPCPSCLAGSDLPGDEEGARLLRPAAHRQATPVWGPWGPPVASPAAGSVPPFPIAVLRGDGVGLTRGGGSWPESSPTFSRLVLNLILVEERKKRALDPTLLTRCQSYAWRCGGARWTRRMAFVDSSFEFGYDCAPVRTQARAFSFRFHAVQWGTDGKSYT